LDQSFTNLLSLRLAALALMMASPSTPRGLKITATTTPPSRPKAFQRPAFAGWITASSKNDSPIAAKSTPWLSTFDIRFGSSQVVRAPKCIYD
jgi:hypothetical protein